VTPSRLRLPALALVVAITLSLAACARPRPPAAEVDGETITNERLAVDVRLFDFLLGLSGSTCGQPVAGETQGSACARLALTSNIQEILVKHYAQANDLTVDDASVASALGQILTSVGGEGKLRAQLAKSDLRRQDLVALARRLLLFNEVQAAVGKQLMTDDRIQQLYQQNIAQFTTIDVAHILVGSEKEADKIAAEATPANFADLAKRYSTDSGSATNGGSLGAIPESTFESQLDPTFVQAALALQPGEISAPVQTQFGWHVIYLRSRDVQPLDAVHDQIVAASAGQIFQGWLQDQLRSADVVVNPRYGFLDLATGQVEHVRSTVTGGGAVLPSVALSPSPSP
jgi:PPIC-type PPIASE domain